MGRFRSFGLALLASAAAVGVGCVAPETVATAADAGAAATGRFEGRVLSSKPEYVTGGDALVEFHALDGAGVSSLKLTLNGRPAQANVTTDAANNVVRAKVEGLEQGANVLRVTGPRGASGEITLTNYPKDGPIFSGPHMTPYECRTAESGMGQPLDENCNAPTRYDWFYRSSDGAFKPYTPGGTAPADLVTTTTIDGETVPYVVRVESGVINRSIYRLAVLDDPATDAFDASEGWNERLGVTFGGGCGTKYNQGSNDVTSVLSDLYLSRGFAFMNSTELVNNQHCNQVLQGETLMMLKEHFIENYGVPTWTVGTGGSGGAIQQLGITQMYPGLLDGLQPSLAYPDSSLHTADCGLIENFFRNEGKDWPDNKKQAVEGFYLDTCKSWERSFVPVMFAENVRGCDLSDESLVYNAKTNPKGVRCTVQEMRANVYGRDPATGFARKPQDNVGLQYGLKALNDGVITPGEFVLLNEKIGGFDLDGKLVAKRVAGDPIAIRNAYKSGLMNSGGGGLANVPILSYRWYTDSVSDIHSRERDLTVRARLERSNGRADNHVIWIAGRTARPGRNEGEDSVDLSAAALDVMTEWLDGMAADPAPLSADKVVAHKPAGAVDAFWTEEGVKTPAVMDWDMSSPLNQVYPIHLEPRLVAGAPVANDIFKCQLKPIDWSEYSAKFAPSQQKRLERVFPDGVCDWSKTGVEQVALGGAYQKWGASALD